MTELGGAPLGKTETGCARRVVACDAQVAKAGHGHGQLGTGSRCSAGAIETSGLNQAKRARQVRMQRVQLATVVALASATGAAAESGDHPDL